MAKASADSVIVAARGFARDGAQDGTLPALTSLRFLAALLVFLFHFPPTGGLWEVVAGQGHVGVNIFFVLSGFLITARYGERLVRGEVRLRDYFVRRAARILPLYYAVLVLSQLVASGSLSFDASRVSEWTLTQALFGESIDDLVVPTSWSLTVEECFYALAPPLFYVLAVVRRRFPRSASLSSAAVLLALTAAFLAIGAVIWTLLEGRGPGSLRSPPQVATHTLFGRFCDFAVGMIAAIVWRSPAGPWRQVIARPTVAVAATVAATSMIVGAQWGMHEAGGLDGPRWASVWAWGLALAPAAAALIVCLSLPTNPVARLLGWAPFVYLGKISYALYLVQLTSIGKGLLYRIVPRQDGALALLMLYLGLSAVSILLYELIEEPARKLILRAAGLEKSASPGPASRWARLGAAAVLAAVVVGQSGSWALSSLTRTLGPVTLADITAAGVAERDMLAVSGSETSAGRDVLLLGLPRRWLEGWGNDLRAPHALRVFVDGAPVPFSRREPETSGPAAFYRGPRAEYLALRLDAPPAEVVVVRETPGLATRVHGERLLGSPATLAVFAAFLGAALSLAALALRARRPAWRMAVMVSLGALAGWWILGLHHLPGSLALIAAECLLLLLLLAVKGVWWGEGTALGYD